MAEVLLLCMRDDEEAAAILADLFYRAGFQTAGGAARPDELDSCAVALVCWSGASQRSTQMREAADRAAQSGKAMIARLDGHPLPPSLWQLPAFDLSQWSFAPEDAVLDGLYVAVERAVTRAREAATRMGRVAASAPEPPVAPRGQTVSDSDLEAEAAFWKRIQSSSNPNDFLSYLDQFGPKGAFAELAFIRLERLGGAPPKPAAAPAQRAQPKAEPATPAAPAWTGWSVSPGSVRPPRFSDPSQDSIDDRLDRRQPDRRPLDPPPPPPRRPEPTRPEAYARDLPPEPPRSPPQRPSPPRLDPVAPDARRAEPRRPDPRYLPPPTPEDGPPAYRPAPPAARRPRYDDIDDGGYRGAPAPAPHRQPPPPRAERSETGGGGRGWLVVLVAVAALGGAGYAMRGLLPSGTDAERAEARPDPSLASTSQDFSSPPSIVAPNQGAPESGLTPPPRGEPFSLDSVGVTESAPSSSIAPAIRERRAAPPPQQRLASARTTTPDSDQNAAYIPPAAASLPPAEAPVSVQPAPIVTTGPSTVVASTPAPAANPDAPVRAAAKVRWSARPTAERLAALYPSRARSSDIEGVVILRCTILPDSRAGCAVLSETPPSYGFGAAALRAAESLRASSTLDDGSNATGAITDVSIRFKVR